MIPCFADAGASPRAAVKAPPGSAVTDSAALSLTALSVSQSLRSVPRPADSARESEPETAQLKLSRVVLGRAAAALRSRAASGPGRTC
jgi:hypothetical protein